MFADDNLKLDEYGRKFSKQLENTVGNGEIARYKNFSFSHNVFRRLELQTHKNQVLFGKGLKVQKTFENIVGKKEKMLVINNAFSPFFQH